jgi:hypothetical protein
MRFSPDSIKATKGRLGDSSLEDWPSFLENSRGEITPHQSPASLPARIAAFSRTPRGLAVICICWVLFLLALVFAFTPRTSWVTQRWVTEASSTAVSASGNDLGGWMARRLYCFPHQPCDAWSPFSEDAPSSLRYEMQQETRMWEA